eukprot:gene24141-9726_t
MRLASGRAPGAGAQRGAGAQAVVCVASGKGFGKASDKAVAKKENAKGRRGRKKIADSPSDLYRGVSELKKYQNVAKPSISTDYQKELSDLASLNQDIASLLDDLPPPNSTPSSTEEVQASKSSSGLDTAISEALRKDARIRFVADFDRLGAASKKAVPSKEKPALSEPASKQSKPSATPRPTDGQMAGAERTGSPPGSQVGSGPAPVENDTPPGSQIGSGPAPAEAGSPPGSQVGTGPAPAVITSLQTSIESAKEDAHLATAQGQLVVPVDALQVANTDRSELEFVKKQLEAVQVELTTKGQ